MGTPTTLVILGTDHSPQLVAERYQPAVFRAFFERVHPDALCIEHPPAAFARGDWRYGEYAYEKRHLALPWARERGVPIYPVDWLPPADDQLLAWGTPDIEAPPFLRPWGYVRGFVSFPAAQLDLDLFFAEADAARRPVDDWYDRSRQAGERDFPRRLGLYRTFMQAMRIKAVARQHPRATILVVIGYYHKGDIEGVLGGTAGLDIVQPSAFGHPAPAEVEAAGRREDRCAILSFNLLGVQSREGPVNWAWLGRLVAQLEQDGPTAEGALLGTRLAVLRSHLPPEEAAAQYAAIRSLPEAGGRFTFDGVEDRGRVDSYYDPFGNLTVGERALLELARERHKAGHAEAARQLRDELAGAARFHALQRQQLAAYWDEYVLNMR